MKSLVLLLLLVASTACAEIYTWKDAKGTSFFTNSLDEIPARYRSRAKLLDVASGKKFPLDKAPQLRATANPATGSPSPAATATALPVPTPAPTAAPVQAPPTGVGGPGAPDAQAVSQPGLTRRQRRMNAVRN
jgi:hypothetical protein